MNSCRTGFLLGCVILPAIVVFTACRERAGERYNGKGTAIHLKYAHGFSIESIDSLKMVRVFSPWQGGGKVMMQYLLRPAGVVVPDSLRHMKVITIPVKRVICFSTTHAGMMSFLGVQESLVGFSGPHLLTDPYYIEKVREGKIRDIGYDQGLNYENIIGLKPDLIITYGINAEVSKDIGRLEELGLPVVLNADYLESAPLGKAEWVKFIASFFDLDTLAEKKFSRVVKEYLALKEVAAGVTARPGILTGLPWKDTWYMPGGRSFAAAFIRDAGGDYLFASDTSRETLPLSIEQVYNVALGAGIWINPGSAVTAGEITGLEPRLATLPLFKSQQVYNNNARMNGTGGNEYWESGVMAPHLILSDLINIFHPGLAGEQPLYFYRRIDFGTSRVSMKVRREEKSRL